MNSGRLLLQFVDLLEKQIYLAQEVNASQLTLPSKTITLFFRTNRKVCEDWFSRMRQKLLAASVACHAPCDIIMNASQRIRDLLNSLKKRGLTDPKPFFTDFENTLVHLVRAMNQLEESDSIEGLIKWIEKELKILLPNTDWSKHFSWMQGVFWQSKGFFERAIDHYTSYFHSTNFSKVMPSTAHFIIDQVILNQLFFLKKKPLTFIFKISFFQITDNYVKLADWEGFSHWEESLENYQKQKSQTSLQLSLDLNYIHSLANFDNQDFHKAKEYASKLPSLETVRLFQKEKKHNLLFD